jgi:hypothetical protein
VRVVIRGSADGVLYTRRLWGGMASSAAGDPSRRRSGGFGATRRGLRGVRGDKLHSVPREGISKRTKRRPGRNTLSPGFASPAERRLADSCSGAAEDFGASRRGADAEKFLRFFRSIISPALLGRRMAT